MRMTFYPGSITKSLKSGYVLAAMMAVLLLAPGANASERSRDVVQQEFKRSFQAVLANPTDAKATLHYAHLAQEMKDYESAIPPLERLLMLNPELPQVRLEIGVMYYRLKSGDMARTYLTQVKNDAKADAALKAKADSYLAKL